MSVDTPWMPSPISLSDDKDTAGYLRDNNNSVSNLESGKKKNKKLITYRSHKEQAEIDEIREQHNLLTILGLCDNSSQNEEDAYAADTSARTAPYRAAWQVPRSVLNSMQTAIRNGCTVELVPTNSEAPQRLKRPKRPSKRATPRKNPPFCTKCIYLSINGRCVHDLRLHKPNDMGLFIEEQQNLGEVLDLTQPQPRPRPPRDEPWHMYARVTLGLPWTRCFPKCRCRVLWICITRVHRTDIAMRPANGTFMGHMSWCTNRN